MLFTTLAPVALAALASAAAVKRSPRLQALYYMTDLDSGNQVAAVRVKPNGHVTNTTAIIATGGKGARAPSFLVGLPGDALNSQNGLNIYENTLYAVNAGDNSVSVIGIDPVDPFKLSLIQKTAVEGDWPNAVGIAPNGKYACVGSTGTKSGVTCYNRAPNGVLSAPVIFIDLPLSPVQSNPPVGPINTVSQILWNNDGSLMYIPVKGGVNGGVGYWATFDATVPLNKFKAVMSSPKGAIALFGSVPMPDNKVFFTDAGFGAGVLQIHDNLTATPVWETVNPGSHATCWAAYSEYNGYYYATDDDNHTMAAFNGTTGELILTILHNGNSEMIEVVSNQDKLYALSHGNYTTKTGQPPEQHLVVLQQYMNGSVHTVQNILLGIGNSNVDGLIPLIR